MLKTAGIRVCISLVMMGAFLSSSRAQSSGEDALFLDSLYAVVKQSEGADKIEPLVELSKYHLTGIFTNYDSSRYYSREILKLCEEYDNLKRRITNKFAEFCRLL